MDVLPNTIKGVKKLPFEKEIIVVDDGSVDATYEVAKELGVKAFKFEKNRGKGAAFRKGIEESKGDIIVQIDADSQFPPSEIPKLIEPLLKKEADITFGSRFLKSSKLEEDSVSKTNLIGNKVDSFLTSIFCGFKVTDVQAGFKAFTRDAIKKINFKEDRFSYEPEIAVLASKRKLKVIDVPISYKQRKGGKSKIKFFSDAYMIIKTIIKTWLKPG